MFLHQTLHIMVTLCIVLAPLVRDPLTCSLLEMHMEVATQNVSFGISQLMVWVKAFMQLLRTLKMYCACGVLGAVHNIRSGMLLYIKLMIMAGIHTSWIVRFLLYICICSFLYIYTYIYIYIIYINCIIFS